MLFPITEAPIIGLQYNLLGTASISSGQVHLQSARHQHDGQEHLEQKRHVVMSAGHCSTWVSLMKRERCPESRAAYLVCLSAHTIAFWAKTGQDDASVIAAGEGGHNFSLRGHYQGGQL